MLTKTAIANFVDDGYVVLRRAVPSGVITECQNMVWTDLSSRGFKRDDRSTWTRPVVRINTREEGPFVAAGTARVLWDAYDQLLGEGTWWNAKGWAAPFRCASRVKRTLATGAGTSMGALTGPTTAPGSIFA